MEPSTNTTVPSDDPNLKKTPAVGKSVQGVMPPAKTACSGKVASSAETSTVELPALPSKQPKSAAEIATGAEYKPRAETTEPPVTILSHPLALSVLDKRGNSQSDDPTITAPPKKKSALDCDLTAADDTKKDGAGAQVNRPTEQENDSTGESLPATTALRTSDTTATSDNDASSSQPPVYAVRDLNPELRTP